MSRRKEIFLKRIFNKIALFFKKAILYLKENKLIVSLCFFVVLFSFALVCITLSKKPLIGETLEEYIIGWNKALSFVSSKIPFSLYATLIVIALPCLVGLIILLIKSKYKLRILIDIVSIASIVVIIFYSVFGFSYQKRGVYQRLNIDLKTEVKREEVAEAARYFVDKLNEKSYEITRDENGLVTTEYSYKEISDLVEKAYQEFEGKTGIKLDFLFDIYSPAKYFYTSFFMNYSGIIGTFFPVFAEPNVCGNMPRINLPTTIAHEMAHSKGITNEGECNFLAYLICATSEDPFIAYAGLEECATSLLNSLYSKDKELHKEIYNSMTEEIRAEIRASNEFYSKYDGSWKDFSTKVNNSYLVSNGVSDGVESYSQSTRGIVAFYYRVVK